MLILNLKLLLILHNYDCDYKKTHVSL